MKTIRICCGWVLAGVIAGCGSAEGDASTQPGTANQLATPDGQGPNPPGMGPATGMTGPGMGQGMGPGMMGPRGRGHMGPGGRGMGPDRGREMGHPAIFCEFAEGALPDAVLAGVREALADEQKAEAQYDAFAPKFGMPFPRLERAEERHADLLVKLLKAHGIEPGDRQPAKLASASTPVEACNASLVAERANVAMYDRLLAAQPPDDVRCVYEHLRGVSASRHIPALERCRGNQP